MAPDLWVMRGVYRTPRGWRLYARVEGKLKPKRITDPGHALAEAELRAQWKAWRDTVRSLLAIRVLPPTSPEARTRMIAALLPRFLAKVRFTDTCWDWTASTSKGYGLFWLDGRLRAAHIVAYEACFGPVPAGCELDHKCRNRRCVNPEHVEPVPHRVNILRGEGRTAVQARKTHCSKGHPLVRTRSQRRCLICKAERAQRPRTWRFRGRDARATSSST